MSSLLPILRFSKARHACLLIQTGCIRVQTLSSDGRRGLLANLILTHQDLMQYVRNHTPESIAQLMKMSSRKPECAVQGLMGMT